MVRIELPTRCCRAIGTSIDGKENDRDEPHLKSTAAVWATQSMAEARSKLQLQTFPDIWSGG